MNDKTLEPNRVYDISYRVVLDHDTEEDIVTAYWTGKYGTGGGLEIVPTNGAPTLYLFRREIVDIADAHEYLPFTRVRVL